MQVPEVGVLRTVALRIWTSSRSPVLAVGLATFIFGFFAGALLNVHLLVIHDPLVHDLRAALDYKSAVLGDGFVLPLVNMAATSFLLKQRRSDLPRTIVAAALVLGTGVTVGFHLVQALTNAVNWSMPTPWHWNFLGVWHASYMLAVASLLWLFLLVAVRVVRREAQVPREVVLVGLGLLAFATLLVLDYVPVQFSVANGWR